jgi:anti-sigma factor RsiW
MACDAWADKLDAYLDGELESRDAAALSTHMRTCAACAAEGLERVPLKRSIAIAGKRYEASSELRAKIASSLAKSSARPARQRRWQWALLAVPALLVLVVSIWFNISTNRENARRQAIFGELADLHVATLASTTPVDVVSTDRHTVKPWFEGKVPFTFNLPELQGSEFTLLGGRVAYLDQSSGAQLLYQLRKHKLSVFIFPDRGDAITHLPVGEVDSASFNVQTWSQNGLRYFIVGDVGAADIEALSKLLRDAG